MKLEVGGVYKARNGERVEILETDSDMETKWPYLGDDGEWYGRDGEYFHLEDKTEHDLIALWDEPTVEQTRPVTFIAAVDALAEDHGLKVIECSVSEGVYTLVVEGK